MTAEEAGADSTRQQQDSTWKDACKTYESSPEIKSLCMQAHGPQSNARNTCTAQCLAQQWNDMVAQRGRQPTDMEKTKYIVIDHVGCYWRCKYTPVEFVVDAARNAGYAGRNIPAPPIVMAPRDALPAPPRP